MNHCFLLSHRQPFPKQLLNYIGKCHKVSGKGGISISEYNDSHVLNGEGCVTATLNLLPWPHFGLLPFESDCKVREARIARHLRSLTSYFLVNLEYGAVGYICWTVLLAPWRSAWWLEYTGETWEDRKSVV